MAGRPRYTPEELTLYFARIGLLPPHQIPTITNLPPSTQLSHLTLLQKHQLIRIPFENLTQHYSWHRVVDVSPRHLFRKIVLGPQHGHGSARGGYCMEVNSLFHTVLLSLGYNVYMAGARVYDPVNKRYGGFSHCVNVVSIGGAKYMVDVGFGANGPTRPILLHAGPAPGEGEGKGGRAAFEAHQIHPASVRLLHEPIPQQTNQDCRVWIYQHRIGADADWVTMYCFVDFEFLLEDIRGLNLNPWRSPHSFFTRKILMTRFTTDREVVVPALGVSVDSDGRVGSTGGGGGDDDDGKQAKGPGSPDDEAVVEGEIDGAIILFEDTLKWRRGGETKLEIKFSGDQERVDALERYFGIVFDEEDRDAIRGTVGEISDAW